MVDEENYSVDDTSDENQREYDKEVKNKNYES